MSSYAPESKELVRRRNLIFVFHSLAQQYCTAWHCGCAGLYVALFLPWDKNIIQYSTVQCSFFVRAMRPYETPKAIQHTGLCRHRLTGRHSCALPFAPLALSVPAQGKEVPPGGKIDDITVLVAVVVKAGSVGRT